MKKVLLVSNEVLHYRQKVYNYLHDRFLQDGYEFEVLADKFQNVDYKLTFKHYEEPFSINAYIRKIRQISPNIVIIFLHLKDKIQFPIIEYCKKKRIPVIYWNIGINSRTPNAKVKNLLFKLAHDRCDALITYTPDTKKYFSEKNQKKLFVAYNTLNLSEIDKDRLPTREETKEKYGIKEKRVILFISRLLPYKKVDLLLEIFQDLDDIAVVIVGPGINENQQRIVNAHSNFYYLGERYGDEVDAIYKMGDVFSTPGHIGLAINQALFWGLPIILLDGFHAPEIYYMKNNVTGYLARDKADFKEYILRLLRDDNRLAEMSKACLEVYDREVSIERMYRGFIEAVHYCEKTKKTERG